MHTDTPPPDVRKIRNHRRILLVAVVLAVSVVLAGLGRYIATDERRDDDARARAVAEREQLLDTIAELQSELREIRDTQRDEQQVEDCVTLYYDDIEIAKGVSQLALGDNLATAVLLDTPFEDLRRLAQEVFDADAALRESLAALEAYREIDPPPDVCPHPQAD